MSAAGPGLALEAMTAGEVLRERLAREEAARVARRARREEEKRERLKAAGLGDMGQGLLFAFAGEVGLFNGPAWEDRKS